MVVHEPWYSRLKWFIMIVLPAFSTFYLALDGIVGVPAEEAVVGVSALVAAFLGTALGISSKNYYNSDQRFDGDLVVTDTEDGQTLRFILNQEADVLAEKDELTFKKVSETV